MSPGSTSPNAALAGLESIAVLYGGRSSEREVSLTSGRAVLAALRSATAGQAAPRIFAVELGTDGRWSLEGEELAPCEALRRLPADTLFFLALHGGEGEDGTIQGFLELCGRAHTGSALAASALCMDKHQTRLALADAGLKVAPGVLVLHEAWSERRTEELARIQRLGGGDVFVKPNRGGSSLGTSRAQGPEAIAAAVERVLSSGDRALVEARVLGVETTCAVLGNRGTTPRALPPVEIRPRSGQFFDYQEKYDAAGAEELCPPRSLAPELVARVAERALAAHRVAGCDGYSRTDFIVPTAGPGAGEPVALEINTLPGLTPRSLSPLAASVVGIDFPSFCLEIVRLALAARRGGAR